MKKKFDYKEIKKNIIKYYKSIPKDMLYTSIAFPIIFFITEKCIDRYLLDVSSAALILTLIVIFFYTKYTYEILRGQDSVSASLWFEQNIKNTATNHQILVHLTNHSKYSIETHCRLDIKLFDDKVIYGGFYYDEWSLYLQPKSSLEAHIDLPNIYSITNLSYIELQEKVRKEKINNPNNFPFVIVLNFWYKRMDSNDEFIYNPKDLYWIDVSDGIVITQDNGLLKLGEEKK